MIDYDSLRERQGLRLFELMPELFERLTRPVERLRTQREAGLR